MKRSLIAVLGSVTKLLTVACALWATMVAGQESTSYNGKWVAKFNAPNGQTREAAVAVKDAGGTWQVFAKNRENPCVGREVPIAVTRATQDEFEFDIKNSALPGCEDASIKAKRVDDKTFEGQLGDGRKVILVRQ
jgi:hypothetical protein